LKPVVVVAKQAPLDMFNPLGLLTTGFGEGFAFAGEIDFNDGSPLLN
jgi:hypothetical protein